jgi:hypothetical protein
VRRRAVNELELKSLYEQGRSGRYVSLAGIARELEISIGTLKARIAAMRAAGKLDDERRRSLCARAGRDRGGRRRARISYDPDELRQLRRAGLGATRIRRAATSLPRRATVGHVRRILRDLGL